MFSNRKLGYVDIVTRDIISSFYRCSCRSSSLTTSCRKTTRHSRVIAQNHIIIRPQELIDAHATYDEELGEWQIPSLAFAGNNMPYAQPQPPVRTRVLRHAMTSLPDQTPTAPRGPPQRANIYFQYSKCVRADVYGDDRFIWIAE